MAEVHITIFIEDTAGNKFDCTVPLSLIIAELAAQFFEAMEWKVQDSQGRGQRAVVELVIKDGNQTRTRRLKGERSLEQEHIEDQSTLRIFPEAIAGMINPKNRHIRLVRDLNELETLSEDEETIEIEPLNSKTAPTEYYIYLNYPSFRSQSPPGVRPPIINRHKIKVVLGAEYPNMPPLFTWETPIFHPNINPKDNSVCLGQLRDKYLPSFGLKNICLMLVEMIQWRNFDIYNAFNIEASKWAADTRNWDYIREIGGSPMQISWRQLIDPSNWGPHAPPASPFRGQVQPDALKAAWDNLQDTSIKIEFNKKN